MKQKSYLPLLGEMGLITVKRVVGSIREFDLETRSETLVCVMEETN